jgi:hypothetical protein
MGRVECSERGSLWAIASAAETAWLELQAGLKQVATVPRRATWRRAEVNRQLPS